MNFYRLNSVNTKFFTRLDGNNIDEGLGNSGTDADITYGAAYGKFGQGASFNGSSSQISYANSTNLTTADITFGIWFNRQGNDSVVNELWSTYNGTTGTRFLILNTNVLDFIAYNSGGTLTIRATATTTIPTADGKWHLATYTYDKANGVANIYLDGKLDTATRTVSAGFALYGLNTTFYLGRNGSATPRWLYGYIDEPFIENRAWSAKEIKAFWNKQKQVIRTK